MVREEEAVYHARVKGKLAKRRGRPKLIDIFCGAGGMTLGFSRQFSRLFRTAPTSDYLTGAT